MNKSNGKFTHTQTYESGDEGDCVAIFDLRHSGKLDLVVSAGGSNEIAVLLGNGDGTFANASFYSTRALGQGPQAVAIADFRGSGNLDIAVVLNNGYPGLFYGNGDGTFQPVMRIRGVDYVGYGLAVGNFNKDGKPDLAVGAISIGIGVLINAE